MSVYSEIRERLEAFAPGDSYHGDDHIAVNEMARDIRTYHQVELKLLSVNGATAMVPAEVPEEFAELF